MAKNAQHTDTTPKKPDAPRNDTERDQPGAEIPENLKSSKGARPAGPDGVAPEDFISAGADEDPVSQAYARTGRSDTTGISGVPADDDAAGEERKRLYERGADIVSRID